MRRPRSASDYADGITVASRSGLAEVLTALGAYREALVLIGGWAPYLILEQFGEQRAFQPEAFQTEAFQTGFVHVGSIDIDLVVNPDLVDADQYATMVELVLARGYEPGADPLSQFQKIIRSPRDGQDYVIRVDFLAPKPLPGRGRSRRHRQVQRDLRARTLEGVEVALSHWFWYDLTAQLPDGAETRVRLKVADVVASLVLKGLAIGDRYAEKDAYDIYALCAYYRGGPAAVAEMLRPFLVEEAVGRGLGAIAEKFRDPNVEGPTWVVGFMDRGDAGSEARIRQDAFMSVHEVCRLLGVVRS